MVDTRIYIFADNSDEVCRSYTGTAIHNALMSSVCCHNNCESCFLGIIFRSLSMCSIDLLIVYICTAFFMYTIYMLNIITSRQVNSPESGSETTLVEMFLTEFPVIIAEFTLSFRHTSDRALFWGPQP